MRRILQTLGLTMLAALATGAVAATAAQAKQAEFTAVKYPAVFTMYPHQEVEWDDYFELTPGFKTECESETYEATVSGASTKLTVTPHYTGCKGIGGMAKTVHLNGCHYVFEAGTTTEDDVHGSAQIVCPPTKQIEITNATCKVDIPPQTIAGALTLTNLPEHGNTKATYITIHVDVTDKLHYTDTDGFLCPFEGSLTRTDGDWVTTIVVKGFEDSGTIGDINTPGTNVYTHKDTEIDIDVKAK